MSNKEGPKTIDISTFSPKQLNALREQLEMELNNYLQSSVALQRAAGDFHSSGLAIEELNNQEQGEGIVGWGGVDVGGMSDVRYSVVVCITIINRADRDTQSTGQQLLLPLSSSVYISGSLESVDKVLIDVGTGYYVEVRNTCTAPCAVQTSFFLYM